MSSWTFIILYVLFAVSGSTLLKFGSMSSVKSLFIIPFVKMNVSWITFLGFIFYGFSFIFYTILLSKYDLSYISPLTVGIVYILLMISAFIFFQEQITLTKIIASSLILIGILLMLKK